jgi:hypothetical protein
MENSPDQSVRKGHQLWIALIPLVVGGFILLFYVLWSAYRDVWAEARPFANSQSGLLEARFDATLRRIDATLEELAERLPKEALAADARTRFRAEIEKDLERQQPGVISLRGRSVRRSGGSPLFPGGAARRQGAAFLRGRDVADHRTAVDRCGAGSLVE